MRGRTDLIHRKDIYRSIDDVAEDPCIERGGEDVFDACLVQPVLRLRNVGGHDQRKREYEQCFY